MLVLGKMESSTICCSTVSVWTKIIGWYQISLNLLLMLCTVVVVRYIDSLTTLDFAAVGISVAEEQLGGIKPTIFIIFLILVISGFAVGVTLLKGVYKQSPRRLDIWIKYTSTWIVVDGIATFIYVVCSTGAGLGLGICRFLVASSWSGFELMVVHSYKTEIEELSSSMTSSCLQDDVFDL